MQFTVCVALVFLTAVQFASASVCVVSFWADWGACIGNCEFGLQVRNRNVVRAPFPERTRDGRLAIRACPPLYQVQTCVPDPCRNGITDFSGLNILIPASPQELRAPHDISHTNEHINADLTATIGVAESDVNKAPPMRILTHKEEELTNEIIVEPTETTESAAFVEVEEPVVAAESIDNTPATAEVMIEITTAASSTTTATPTTKLVEETNSTVVESEEITNFNASNETEIVQPIEREIESPVTTTWEPTIFEETTSAENLTVFNVTLPPLNNTVLPPIRLGGDGPMRVVLGRHNSTTAGESPETTEIKAALPTKASTTTTTAPTTTTSTAATTTQMSAAKRREIQKAAVSKVISDARTKGVAPNPTEIERAMRGSTDGAPCVDGQGQCCRQPMKTECANGRAPQIVMRYYRNAEDTECVAYSYPYCSLREEAEHPPIKWEQDCYDLCYTSDEKKTMPLFKEISFRNGFRLTARRAMHVHEN